jgi:hypothetical protein
MEIPSSAFQDQGDTVIVKCAQTVSPNAKMKAPTTKAAATNCDGRRNGKGE